MIVAGASPGETKMWAAVRENGDFFTFVDHVKMNKDIIEIFSLSGSQAILVFPYKTWWRYSDGNPLMGALNTGGV